MEDDSNQIEQIAVGRCNPKYTTRAESVHVARCAAAMREGSKMPFGTNVHSIICNVFAKYHAFLT